MAQATSSAPFGVRDASGTVLVDPAGARFDHAELVVDRFQKRSPYGPRGTLTVSLFGRDIELASADANTLNYESEEWVVRAGQRVYLLGEASDRSGQLVVGKPASGPSVLSTRSEQELAHRFQTQQTLARIGAAVAGVAGVVLLVIGLLG